MSTNFTVNGKAASTDAPPATPLLWVIREGLKLTGTKFGCGTGLCGACMVHVDGKRDTGLRYRRQVHHYD
jgi:isoquinoline 1-oxidoreductase subunit alpha